MAVTQHGDTFSFKAGADFSAKKYFFVKQSADDTVVLGAAAADKVIGTISQKVSQGETVPVARLQGGATIKVILGGTVNRDAYVTSDSNGKAVAATTGQHYVARAVHGGVAGDIIEIEGQEGVMP